jgi:DNA processing protein
MSQEQLSLFGQDEGHDSSDIEGNMAVPSSTHMRLEPQDERAIHLLALADIEGAGFSTVRALYEYYGVNLPQLWDAHTDDLLQVLGNARIPNANQVVRQIQSRTKQLITGARERYLFYKMRNTQVIFRHDPSYPPALLDLSSPPAWIFVEGNADILHNASIIAVVGTRTPTIEGTEVAKRISVGLIRLGCVVLSGLAEGIDEVAHRVAVDYAAPTIAVLGHGIEIVYPAATSYLRRQLINSGGAIVSEYLPRDNYSRDRFVQRNRIQAALSQAVTIVEGTTKSGTAHTVRFARQLNRALFGVYLGQLRSVPQHELLHDLARQNYPVFNWEFGEHRKELVVYLSEVLRRNLRDQVQSPRLFNGLLREIERLAQQYDATEEDFQWFIHEVQKLAPEGEP